jgi:hypothetical protein
LLILSALTLVVSYSAVITNPIHFNAVGRKVIWYCKTYSIIYGPPPALGTLRYAATEPKDKYVLTRQSEKNPNPLHPHIMIAIRGRPTTATNSKEVHTACLAFMSLLKATQELISSIACRIPISSTSSRHCPIGSVFRSHHVRRE